MPLVRSDGVPTQHMRALAYWMAAPGLDGHTSVQVCGQEWFAHVTCRRQLMAELVHAGPEGNGFHPYHDIFHGMVAKEQQAIKSSKKDALLIDHLIEWIDEQIDADPQLAEVRRRHPAPERVAAQIALGYFLLHPATKRVNFEPEKLLLDGKSLGWDMARARTRGTQRWVGRQQWRSRRGRRLPLRGRPLRDVPTPSPPRLPATQRDSAGALCVPPGALVPRPRSQPARRAGGRDGARRKRPRARTSGGETAMRTLLVDNHDSYTYNVFHLLAGVAGEEPIVVDNDADLLAGAVALGLRRDRPLPRPRQPRPLARLLRLQRHPPLQRDPGARHLPRSPGARAPARRQGRIQRPGGDARPAQQDPPPGQRASSRASRRASRSSATTRWRSPTWDRTATSPPGPTTAS